MLKADGKENSVTMPSNGKMKFATLWKMDMQLWGKTFCNFGEKGLAKNTVVDAAIGTIAARLIAPGSERATHGWLTRDDGAG